LESEGKSAKAHPKDLYKTHVKKAYIFIFDKKVTSFWEGM
jgi:hypothetical protein